MSSSKVGIVAFAFGTPATNRSNRLIAEIARTFGMVWASPVYTQMDIDMGDYPYPVTRIQEKQGDPLPTLHIARGAIQWAMEHHLHELWVSAAKPHLWRCLRDLRYAARERDVTHIAIMFIPEIGNYPTDSWFDQDGEQLRASSRKRLEKRERILCKLPMLLYRLVCHYYHFINRFAG